VRWDVSALNAVVIAADCRFLKLPRVVEFGEVPAIIVTVFSATSPPSR